MSMHGRESRCTPELAVISNGGRLPRGELQETPTRSGAGGHVAGPVWGWGNVSGAARGSGDAVHGRAERVVAADQFERLVPGAWGVEQGSYDCSDVGAGDAATGDRRACE